MKSHRITAVTVLVVVLVAFCSVLSSAAVIFATDKYSDPAYEVVAVALESVLGYKLRESEMTLTRTYEGRQFIPIVHIETDRMSYGGGKTTGSVAVYYDDASRTSGSLDISMNIYDYRVNGFWGLEHTSRFTGLGVLGQPWISNKPSILDLIWGYIDGIW